MAIEMTRDFSSPPWIRFAIALPAVALLAAAPISRAQMTPEKARVTESESATIGWHVVRTGENLRSITTLYLGSDRRWQENHRLNPDVADPNLIRPGDRLRVLLSDSLPPRIALLERLANRVESLLNPLPWQRAVIRELLRASDAVRTFENASAELSFSGRGSLIVTEESIVYLRAADPQVRPRDPARIEIEVGQADYALAGTFGRSTGAEDDIEIVLGSATASPTPGEDGKVHTRARMDRAKASQLMVYGGNSALSTPSGTVEVSTGMGTSIAADGAASPPERLLPSPELVAPAADGTVPISAATLTWQPVTGAAAYVGEVCLDRRCARLIERTEDILASRWQVGGLPQGRLFWRVTARSASGLDGYPSATRPLNASAAPPKPVDQQAPWARVRFLGRQVTIPERFLIGLGTTIELESGDIGDAGVDRLSLRLDGEPVAPDALAGPWAAGDHRLEVEVRDRAGNRFEHPAIDFTYDPVPPILRWGRDPSASAGETQGPDAAPPIPAAQIEDRTRFEWAPGPGRSWRAFVGHVGVPKESPVIGIRPLRGALKLTGTDMVISRSQPLWLAAVDEHGRAVHLSVLVLRDGAGARLVVDAVDLLGNTTRRQWPLESNTGRPARTTDR